VPSSERRRREDRGAEGAERGKVLGEGVPPSPADYGIWRSVVSSPSGVRGGAPAANAF